MNYICLSCGAVVRTEESEKQHLELYCPIEDDIKLFQKENIECGSELPL